MSVFDQNPYDAHPALASTEADLLWEYAKLAQHIKDLTATTKLLSEQPDQHLLGRLRVLERKMSLVLTLFKASVWGVINEQAASTDLFDNTTTM
ncbi:DASH complex subunit Dad3-domain-containing protein [Boletus edulis]|uniref:DASH complex subunit DAD3 n=1 Tax=Boletus edulis BED1 TaxID=1328754 RepID=A0AAD4GJF7_BOLED|nr:DASH complex subunit Dad3-domain-containing protein [Boletus edulis]KAF8414382.1 DASH complex subunit Dad3-domain-containing protein [Boletus edulis BED1]KAF8447792.1 DASH complex subunit Dad3-domain-containing protein [Boletus edulis BED1]